MYKQTHLHAHARGLVAQRLAPVLREGGHLTPQHVLNNEGL